MLICFIQSSRTHAESSSDLLMLSSGVINDVTGLGEGLTNIAALDHDYMGAMKFTAAGSWSKGFDVVTYGSYIVILEIVLYLWN